MAIYDAMHSLQRLRDVFWETICSDSRIAMLHLIPTLPACLPAGWRSFAIKTRRPTNCLDERMVATYLNLVHISSICSACACAVDVDCMRSVIFHRRTSNDRLAMVCPSLGLVKPDLGSARGRDGGIRLSVRSGPHGHGQRRHLLASSSAS